ncbi:anti-sigma factor family protein [Thermogemmata fonticola]|uniref:Zinc-finger domain-containing protein n=1 Tax=Thermogemmata fonticola TaxID=2755323 RepID=A0A7V8VBN8_9BACT|nr:hypothetical protein [Thermogemmata fonticola]MBA2225086.1 hypothetical protein [Thermogemmata fonticola]
MPESPHPPPQPSDQPPQDPLEEELVAYLDGELPEDEARQMEQRLAADPELRRRALLLKKTYDLLDYLPLPEASPDFTTRTLEKVPALRSAAPSSRSDAAAVRQAIPSTSQPVVMAATGPLLLPSTRWLAAWKQLWIAALCLTLGSLGGYGLLTWVLSAPSPSPRPSASDEPSLTDHRLIEMLPYYIGVDDLSFLLRLAEPEYFGDDPLVEHGISRPPAQMEGFEPPSSTTFAQLVEEFRRLAPNRQAALRELDRELFAQDPAEREYLLRILEAYALWLSRLAPDQRRFILSAGDTAQRLQRVREIREQQWLEALPVEQQKRIRSLSTQERIETIRRLKRHETDRRESWSFIRRHAEEIAANRIPWPFHDEALRKVVVEFARQAFQLDEPGKERLTANERQRYVAALHTAEQAGGSAWFSYGREVYNLSRKYERFLLPPPRSQPVLDHTDLGPAARFFEKGRAQAVTAPFRGKWPEFALAVLDYSNSLPPTERPKLPPLGPARLEELREPLRRVIEQELWPKLRPREREALTAVEGKWPDYCRELRKWAALHDVSLPGIMLPGSPRHWETLYGARLPGPGAPPGLKFPPFPPPIPNRK